MHDTPQSELDAITAERARIFSRKWFADLMSGRLGAGDTFWLGNYGIGLAIVPAVVLLAAILAAAAPQAMAPVLAVLAAVAGIYRMALLRAFLIVTRRQDGPRGWFRAGAAIIAIDGLALLGYAASALTG